jgi:hypothetical protein
LAHSLAREPEKRTVSTPSDALDLAAALDPGLARVVDAWPALPEPIRRAMLALVDAAPPRPRP